MSRKIAEMDLKKLWGAAAGQCSICHADLIHYLDSQDDTLVGEMAHIIGYKKDAARGSDEHQYDNSYSNLILLCPTCHTLVDKNDGKYTVEELHMIKGAWEGEVKRRLLASSYDDLSALCKDIYALLSENHAIWMQCGPESEAAIQNPLSCQAEIWDLCKVARIVPNNQKIVALLDANIRLLPIGLIRVGALFRQHTNQFRIGCSRAIDSQMRFPSEFETEIVRHVES